MFFDLFVPAHLNLTCLECRLDLLASPYIGKSFRLDFFVCASIKIERFFLDLLLCAACRWLHKKIVEDLQFSAKSDSQQNLCFKILTGGSSGDELIPNSELSRNSCLHESVYVWLRGMLELAAQKLLLSELKEQKHVSLAFVVTKEQIEHIVDHLIGITDSSSKK